MATAKPDPIIALWHALFISRKPPPLAWVVEHGVGGQDPVSAAWSRTSNDNKMREVLCEIFPDNGYGDDSYYADSLLCNGAFGCGGGAQCAACCRAIRRNAKTPTMHDVLRALGRSK